MHTWILKAVNANRHKLQLTSFLPPVAFAMRLRSLFKTRLTAMAPTSTKYFKHMSSMPPVVSITFAPDAKIFWILSLVISDSLQPTKNTYLVLPPHFLCFELCYQFHNKLQHFKQYIYKGMLCTKCPANISSHASQGRAAAFTCGCLWYLPRVSLCQLMMKQHSKFNGMILKKCVCLKKKKKKCSKITFVWSGRASLGH